jgi:hypothetical protein
MSYSEKILRGVKLTGALPDASGEAGDELMRNADYLRQSSALIHDALQKGMDVLQLANGDIVTTGSKIVVTQYGWDKHKSKLVKASTTSTGGGRRGRPRKRPLEMPVPAANFEDA